MKKYLLIAIALLIIPIGVYASRIVTSSSNYIIIPNSSTIADNLSVWSASVWFKTKGDCSATTCSILSKIGAGGAGSGTGWVIAVNTFPFGNDGYAEIQSDGSNWVGWNTNGTVNDGTWHMITIVIQGSTMTFYFDGTTNNTSVNSQGTLGSYANASNIVIGANAVPGEFIDGSVADARIYNRALTANEVRTLYSGGDPSVYYNGSCSLIGHWLLFGNSGNLEPDSSCSKHLGNVIGTGLFAGLNPPRLRLKPQR